MFYITGNNIEMTRGDTLRAVINMRDPLGVISYPETGDVVTFAAMLTRDGEAVITKTIPHDTMTLTLDPEDTEELAYGRYIFTVKITRANGDVDTFIDDGALTLVKTWRHKPHDAYALWSPWIPLNTINGWLAPGGAAPVDAALNISSDHPVQNKVLYQALAGKVDKMEGMGLSHNDLTDALAQKLTDIETGATKVIVDALFVSGSTNPVQSKTIQAALAAKVDKEVGKGLSSNDYTSAEKEKLAGIEAGAQVNPDLSGYATKSEMNTALGEKADSSSVHNVPAGGTAGQVLKKRSGTDYDAEWAEESGGGGSVPVDGTLSPVSENPVQNKAIYKAIENLHGENILYNGLPHKHNTLSDSDPWGWGFYRGSSSITYYANASDGFQTVFPVGITSSAAKFQWQKYLIRNGANGEGTELGRVNGGKSVAISFELGSDVALEYVNVRLTCAVYDGGTAPDRFYLINSRYQNTGWVKYEGIGVVPDWWDDARHDQYTKNLGLIIEFKASDTDFDGTVEKTVRIRNIKLEFGNRCTPFSHSALDLDDMAKMVADKHSIPSGGTAGQFLVKSSATDYDAAWITVPNANGVSF